MNHPDFSNYAAHFTKSEEPHSNKYHPTDSLPHRISGTALERLQRILEEKKIYSHALPYTDRKAVCFTECPWSSLLGHADKYSSYGIGFKKEVLFSAGGGPVHYIRQDLFDKQRNHGNQGKGFCEELYTMMTPFHPSYAPD